MTLRAITATAVVALLSACGGKGSGVVAVPRRTSYYRIEIPAPVYDTIMVSGTPIAVNQAAMVEMDSLRGWLTVNYATPLTTMFITVTRLTEETASESIDNRVERLSMNTGGAYTEIEEFETPRHLVAKVLTTAQGSPSPVQFLATDGCSLMVSGTAVVDGAATSPSDSIAPVVEMLKRDVVKLINDL